MTTVTAKRERNNKGAAFIITIAVHAAILLFLFYYVIITPLPPYKEIPPPEITVEADFGNNINGSGHVEQSNMGENDNPEKSAKEASHPVVKQSSQLLTNQADDPSNIKSAKTPTKTDKVDTVTAPQPQVSVALAGVLNKFSKNKGGTPGGDGTSNQAGNAGTPNGINPGESMDTDPKKGYFLRGRNILRRPSINADCHEEGTVVLRIVVDQNGNVISATPGEQGSNTTSACLYAKAKDAAKTTKFSPSPDGTPEQQGTLTVIFTVH